jgi:hypothetical protein
MRWYPAVLAVLLLAGAAASFSAAAERFALEAADRRVEVVMPYEDLRELAVATRKEPAEVLALLRQEGLTAVFFPEQKVEEGEESGNFTVLSGQELYLLARAGGWEEVLRREKVKETDTCFLSGDESTARRLSAQLGIKTGDGRYLALPGVFGAVTSASRKSLTGLGLGFPAAPFSETASAGLRAIVQVRSWPGATKENLDSYFASLRNFGNLAGVCFDGDALPGYPQLLPVLAENLEKLNVPLLSVEFSPQKGLAEVAALLDNRVIQLHSAGPEDGRPLPPDQLRQRLLLAASERNVRFLLFSPLPAPPAGDPLEANLRFLAELRKGLERKGYAVGPARPLPPLAQPAGLTFLAGLGVLSGGLLFLRNAGLRRYEPWLGVVLAGCWGGLVAISPLAAAKLAAFAAAVVFPVWGLAQNVRAKDFSLAKAVLLLLRTTAVSLAGALFVTGLLADTRFMVKLDQFSGVKAAYLFPLVIAAAVFLVRSGGLRRKKGLFDSVRGLLNRPILWKWALVALLLGAALALYVLRSGTEEILPPPALELKARALLDQLLLVRPRTKEFLVGHPFLLLLFFTGYRDERYLPLLLIGAVGQVSVVNTYCHVHTPLFISLLRTFHGLWLGILSGILIVFLWRLVARFGKPLAGNPGAGEGRG